MFFIKVKLGKIFEENDVIFLGKYLLNYETLGW